MALTMTTTAATTGKTRFTLVKKYCKAFINFSLLSTSDSSPGISRAGAIVPTKIIRKIPFRNLIQKFCKCIFSPFSLRMLFVLKNILTRLQRHLLSLKVNMQNKIHFGEKVLQRFHELLIAVYF